MNNSENKDILDNTADEAASARAEKIRAIRESLRNAQETVEDVQSEAAPEAVKANAVAMGVPAAEPAAASSETVDKAKTANESVKTVVQPAVIADAPAAVTEMPKKKKSGKKKKKKKKKTVKQQLRGLFPEKGDSVAEIIRKIVFLISIIAIIVCGYLVAEYYLDLWRSRMQYNDISGLYETYEPGYSIADSVTESPDGTVSEKYYTMLNGARKLLDINPDTVGYLRIPSKDGSDPIIDLPVVQAEDNMKYLDRNFKGEDSRTGTLFLDFRNSFDKVYDHRLAEPNSDHLVIYGHNMADESMFGKLKYYYGSAEYYTEHPIIQLNSNYETYKYKIFAIFIVDAKDETATKYDCWNQLVLDSEESFYNFVNAAKKRTIYTNEVDVKYGDSLLSLSTCHYLLKDRSRLMIMARSLRPGEDEYEGTEKSKRNDNIQWPSMYYNTKTNEKYDEEAIFVPYGPEEAVKEAEAKLAAEKKKKQEEEKKKEKASREAEEAKNTTTKTTTKKTTTSKAKSTSKKTDSKTTKAKTVKTTAVKTSVRS